MFITKFLQVACFLWLLCCADLMAATQKKVKGKVQPKSKGKGPKPSNAAIAGTNSGFSFLICPMPLNDSNQCHNKQEQIASCKKDVDQLISSLNATSGALDNLRHSLDHLFRDLNKTITPSKKNEGFGMLKSLYAMLTTDGTEHAFLGQVTWIVGWIDGVFGSKILKTQAVCGTKGACDEVSRYLTSVKSYLQHVRAFACFSDKGGKAAATPKSKHAPAVLSPLKVYNVNVQSVDETDSRLPHWVVWHSSQAVSWVLDELKRCWPAAGSGATFKACNLNVVFQMNDEDKNPKGKGDRGKAAPAKP